MSCGSLIFFYSASIHCTSTTSSAYPQIVKANNFNRSHLGDDQSSSRCDWYSAGPKPGLDENSSSQDLVRVNASRIFVTLIDPYLDPYARWL